jgi:deoxyadenosine/deoxycytidine kinase
MARKKRADPAPRLIAIEGPLGVGKSTLAKYLARRLGARSIFEEIEENPFLKSFYQDPRRYAFQTQMFFLLSRYQQQVGLKQEDLFHKVTVCDYVFQKDRIFAYLTLSEDELSLYERVYRTLDPRVPSPDLVVYLQARPEVLIERIRTRNRDWERPIKLQFLEELIQAYNDYFFHWQKSPLLVINTSEIDFVETEAHLEAVLGAIRRMRKGVQYFNPSGG